MLSLLGLLCWFIFFSWPFQIDVSSTDILFLSIPLTWWTHSVTRTVKWYLHSKKYHIYVLAPKLISEGQICIFMCPCNRMTGMSNKDTYSVFPELIPCSSSHLSLCCPSKCLSFTDNQIIFEFLRLKSSWFFPLLNHTLNPLVKTVVFTYGFYTPSAYFQHLSWYSVVETTVILHLNY